jgi:hypothetical protein
METNRYPTHLPCAVIPRESGEPGSAARAGVTGSPAFAGDDTAEIPSEQNLLQKRADGSRGQVAVRSKR